MSAAIDENVRFGGIARSSVLRVSNRPAVPFEFVVHIEVSVVEAPLAAIYGAVGGTIKFVALTRYEIPCLCVGLASACREQEQHCEKEAAIENETGNSPLDHRQAPHLQNVRTTEALVPSLRHFSVAYRYSR